MKIPPRNLPLESEPWGAAIDRERDELRKQVDSLLVWQQSVLEREGNSASSATSTNVQVRQNTRDIIELWGRQGLPPGWFPGSVLQGATNGDVLWMPQLAGVVPTLYVMLEQGNPSYEWSYMLSDDITGAMPEVVFTNDGMGFEFVDWDDGTGTYSLLPINYEIQVSPHADGDEFEARIPSDGSWTGSGTVGHHTLLITNVSSTRTANVLFGGGTLGGVYKMRYKDSQQVMPWDLTDPDSSVNVATLHPNQQLGWIVERSPIGESNLTPVLARAEDALDRFITYPVDDFYWRYVYSRRLVTELTAFGDLEVVTDGVAPLVNRGSDTRRVGLLVATLTDAPTGSAVEVDVLIGGVSILSAPLTIPVGATEVMVEPSTFTHGRGTTNGPSVFEPCALWLPGQGVTVEINAVGSTTPGKNLTLQLYYG